MYHQRFLIIDFLFVCVQVSIAVCWYCRLYIPRRGRGKCLQRVILSAKYILGVVWGPESLIILLHNKCLSVNPAGYIPSRMFLVTQSKTFDWLRHFIYVVSHPISYYKCFYVILRTFEVISIAKTKVSIFNVTKSRIYPF